jgi:APA family basic amino acid/polyamine antiporter
MGCSRLAYSMAELGLIGHWLSNVHPKFRTPVRAIVVFSGVATLEAIIGFLTGSKALETIANMYAFGAMLAYFLSSIALLSLRKKEPHTPRPYKVPLNIRWGEAEIPLLGICAVLGTLAMLVIVLWTHEFARIMGPSWVAVWVLYYFWYRFRNRRPVLGNLERNWDADQLEILAATGEWELYERLKIEIERRKRLANHSLTER